MHPAPTEIHDGLLEQALSTATPRAAVWEPRAPLVVLGRSNDAGRECDLGACRELGVPLIQRRGGGGTVLLAPGMVVLTLAGPVGTSLAPRPVFERVNAWIAGVLATLGVADLRPAGISDLCLGGRKVLGCSLAFRRGWALYQGSLLVEGELELVERCLRHPSREPAYRAGRTHAEFLTTLRREGHALGVAPVRAALEKALGADTVTELFIGPAREARCA